MVWLSNSLGRAIDINGDVYEGYWSNDKENGIGKGRHEYRNEALQEQGEVRGQLGERQETREG